MMPSSSGLISSSYVVRLKCGKVVGRCESRDPKSPNRGFLEWYLEDDFHEQRVCKQSVDCMAAVAANGGTLYCKQAWAWPTAIRTVHRDEYACACVCVCRRFIPIIEPDFRGDRDINAVKTSAVKEPNAFCINVWNVTSLHRSNSRTNPRLLGEFLSALQCEY